MPGWFVNYNLLIHFVFFIITFLVCFFSFRIYRLSQQRQPKLFATSFLFISLAFLIEAILNLLILFKINENISLAAKIMSVKLINLVMVNTHLILFIVGLVTLTYMTFKVRSAKIYSLLLIITLLSVFLVSNTLYFYYLLSFILLIYICWHYLFNYLSKKRINSLLVFVAFILLAVGNIPILFSVMNHETFYVVGHVIELIAYTLILVNLILVQRHEQKTRSTSNRA